MGANFLSDSIRDAVTDRLATPQSYQKIDERRLFEDLLSSMPMCFNLFGEASRDPARAANVAAALWGTNAESAAEVRFEWSPCRRDQAFLNDGTAF